MAMLPSTMFRRCHGSACLHNAQGDIILAMLVMWPPSL